MNPKRFRIEYDEVHLPLTEEPEIYAPAPECIRILDVTRVGQELRWRYCVIWGAEERPASGDGNGA